MYIVMFYLAAITKATPLAMHFLLVGAGAIANDTSDRVLACLSGECGGSMGR